VLLHANGEPLGEFDPHWPVFTDWLRYLGVTPHRIGCSGHASPEDLHEFVERVAPGVVPDPHVRTDPPAPTAR
jgi:ribonuclease J